MCAGQIIRVSFVFLLRWIFYTGDKGMLFEGFWGGGGVTYFVDDRRIFFRWNFQTQVTSFLGHGVTDSWQLLWNCNIPESSQFSNKLKLTTLTI